MLVAHPLERHFDEIKAALQVGLFVIAFTSAMTLPDICAALESENGKSGGPKYKDWCERYLKKRAERLTSEDWWHLRCGITHTGKLLHQDLQYGRVVLTLPSRVKITMGKFRPVGDEKFVLVTEIGDFLDLIVDACREWYAEKGASETVQFNKENLIRFRPEGFSPHVTGMPVIA